MEKVMNYLLFPLVWRHYYLKNDIGDKGNQVKRLVLSPIKLGHDHKQVGPREHGAVKSFVQVKLSEDYVVSHHSAIFLCALRTEFSMSMGWYLIPRRINVSSRAPTTKTASWCSAMQKIKHKFTFQTQKFHSPEIPTSITAYSLSPSEEAKISCPGICLHCVAPSDKP